MKIDLTGKTAVVTGSSAGIGWGCAKGLAEAGAAIVINGRKQEALALARDRLLAAVPKATVRTVAADLSNIAGCNTLVNAEPMCDILVNNIASGWSPKDFFKISDEDWEASFYTSVMPGVRLSRSYLKSMMERGWGRIVFLSSVEATIINADSLDYGFGKAAVLNLSRGLAKVCRGSGVTVNAVVPGPTMTEGFEALINDMAKQAGQEFNDVSDAAVKQRYPTSLNGRAHGVEEVASLVVYVCSMQASATTGAALRAEGGIVESIV